MAENINDKDWRIIEGWLQDPSFSNWALKKRQQDEDRWENYLNQHPEHWELAKVARMLVVGVPLKKIVADERRGKKALERLMSRVEKSSKVQEKKLTGHSGIAWFTIAATFIIITGITVRYYLYNPRVELSTGFGQQLETQLSDGSSVTLNANSRIYYYKLEPRKIWLDGEAYFEVKKLEDTHQRFQVFTNDLLVTVLGTSFNVNTRNEQTKVYLEEGTVTLNPVDTSDQEIVMKPGDVIAYSKKSNQLEQEREETAALENTSWKEGALIFKDTPLMEALFQIEDIYGIQFVIQTEELRDETISGGVPIRDLEVTLSTLSEIYGIQMKSAGKRYFVSGRSGSD